MLHLMKSSWFSLKRVCCAGFAVLVAATAYEASKRYDTFASCAKSRSTTTLACQRPLVWAQEAEHPVHFCARVIEGECCDGEINFGSLSHSTACHPTKVTYPAFGIETVRLEDTVRADPSLDVDFGGWRMTRQLEVLVPVLKAAPPGAVAVDCGMFAGLYTQVFLAVNKQLRVWAFNPTAPHRAWASRNLVAAGFGGADVCVAPYALNSDAGVEYMGTNAGSGLLNWGFLDTKATNDQRVESVAFRSWLASLGDAGVYLLKLEAMGVEAHIIRCADDLMRLGRVKHILARSHSKAAHAEIVARLKRQGFEVRVLSEPDNPDEEGGADGRGCIFGTWRQELVGAGTEARARAQRLRVAAAARPDAGKISCSRVAGKERCCCSGLEGAGEHSDPAYGTHCASWDEQDEEPWCVVDKAVCADDAFASTNALGSKVGHHWAHAPCK